jgi:hypothetical protein
MGDRERVTPVSYDPSLDPSLEPSEGEREAALPPSPPETPVSDVIVSGPENAQTAGASPEPTQSPAPAAADPPTTKAITEQPVIAAYHDVFLRYPSKAVMVQILNHGIADLGRWGEILTAWCQAGYSPTNVRGMFDWYDDPSRMASVAPKQSGGTRGGKGPASKVAASMRAIDEFEAMMAKKAEQ